MRRKNPEDHHYHSTLSFSQLGFKDIQIDALIMITCVKQDSQILMKKMSLMSAFIALHSFSSLNHETIKGGNCGHILHTSRKAETSQQWLHCGSPPVGNGTMNMSMAIKLVTSAGSKLLNMMTSIPTAHELQNLTSTCNWCGACHEHKMDTPMTQYESPFNKTNFCSHEERIVNTSKTRHNHTKLHY